VKFRPALLATFVVASACADDRGPSGAGGWRTEITTAGDTTVVRTVGASAEAAVLELVEEVSIGRADGPTDEMFATIREVVPLAAGGVLVYDGGLRLLREYDAGGAHVRTIGGRGQGPGEYQSPGGIAVSTGGTIFLWDRTIRRLLRYSSSGAFGGYWDVPLYQWGGASEVLIADLGDKVFLRVTLPDPRRESERTPRGEAFTTEAAVRIAGDGSVTDTILAPRRPTAAEQGMITLNITVGRQVVQSHAAAPLMPEYHATFSPLGYFISAHGGSYSILLHRGSGGPLRIESDVARVRASGEERKALAEEFEASIRRSRASVTDRWEVPETKPFFSGLEALRADADGRIWARLHWTATLAGGETDTVGIAKWVEPVVYDVFEPDGTFMGRLQPPSRSEYAAARGDKLWLILRDEFDVQRLARFRIVRSDRR